MGRTIKTISNLPQQNRKALAFAIREELEEIMPKQPSVLKQILIGMAGGFLSGLLLLLVGILNSEFLIEFFKK